MPARAYRAEAELARTKAALDLVGRAHALSETLTARGAAEAVAMVINPLVDELAKHTRVARACAPSGPRPAC